MAILHDPHPSQAQLQAFDAGQLAPAEQEAVLRHLEECGDCGRSLDTLPEGPLVALLRAFAGPGSATGVRGVEALPDLPEALAGHPRYRVLEALGAGGMGVVYKAVHRLMDRVVALKVIDPRLTGRPALVDRFRREVRAAARLAHPNIVAAYDADQAGDTHFLVMEYVNGTTLDREVGRRGPLPVREACDLVRQAALGLQHAHERGMVHRDIKPHNLLRTPGGQVKILDFGLAHLAEGAAPAATPLPSGAVVGTPDYMAPEQAREPAHADARADVYGLGCTLYYLLAGRPPFPDGTALQKLLAHQQCRPPALAAARDDVPDDLVAILDRMLAKDPARRYPTAAGVAADLARFAGPVPVRTARRGPAWRRTALAAGALTAVVGLALVAYFARPGPRSVRPEERGADSPPGLLPQEGAAAPAALASAEDTAAQKRRARERALAWLRANNRWGPGHPVVPYAASCIDKDLDAAEAFQVLLGPGLVKSVKPTLLLGRAGELHVLELAPELARGCPVGEQGCQVQNFSAGDDLRRATPRVLLSDPVIRDAARLHADRPITGSVAYHVLDRWPGQWALRLTYYFGARGRTLLLAPGRLPDADQGTLPFSFPPLGKPEDVRTGPGAVFLEVVTRDDGRRVVESNAAVAAVSVTVPDPANP